MTGRRLSVVALVFCVVGALFSISVVPLFLIPPGWLLALVAIWREWSARPGERDRLAVFLAVLALLSPLLFFTVVLWVVAPLFDSRLS